MRQNSVGAAATNCERPMDPGVWMRPIFALLASGLIYIEQWIQQVIRLISYSLLNATLLLPSASFKRRYGQQTTLVHESST
jgi:hypothetical protein